MIDNQLKWPKGPTPVTKAMTKNLNLKTMLWVHSMVGYYGREFSRHQFFKLFDIDALTYERKIEAKYEEDESTDKPGAVLMTFIDLIQHENKQYISGKTIKQMLPQSLHTAEFTEYLKGIGMDINNAPQEITGSFDDQRIFDFLYFDNPNFQQSSYFNGRMKITDKGIKLKANRNYQKGEELRFSLGSYKNDEQIAKWGKIEIDNPFEYFEIFPQTHGKEFLEIYKKHFILYDEDITGDRNGKEFRFHIHQVNHRFLQYLRGL